jgi:arylsulfatase A-like enzyme
MADAITLDFAKRLLSEEQLGQGAATDVLAVSLSATDYVGHAYGPDSLEAEDQLLRVDRMLGDFFAFIDQQVGADQVLYVLSSDHGISAAPEYTLALGMSSGRHDPDEFVAAVNDGLAERFGIDQPLVIAFHTPGLYLDVDLIREQGLDVAEVERATADEILKVPGFALALTRTDLLAGRIPPGPIAAKVYRAFHPTRSGNVLVVQDVSWYLAGSPDTYASMHGSPYPYDTYVPILFAGPGIQPQTVARPVGPEDVAATIAGYLGIDPPSGSLGTPLTEVLQ